MTFGIVLKKTAGRFFMYRWQDVLIKMALFLYLIPSPPALIARLLWENMRARATESGMNDVSIVHKRAAVLRYSHVIDVNRGFRIYMSVTIIFVCVMLFLLIKKVFGYVSEKKTIMSMDICRKADIPENELKELKRMVYLKRDVQIFMTSLPGAFTIGYVHPVIMIPESLQGDKRDIVLMHEMYHVKRNDILYGFLIFTVICIHWFNPLVYFLPMLFNRSCELNCDEMVLRHLSAKQRKLYAQEIYLQSEAVESEGSISAKFGGYAGLTKERVVNIMQEKKENGSGKKKYWAGILTFMVWIISSLPVCAYERVKILEIDGNEKVVREACENFIDSDILVTTNGNIIFETENTEIRFEEQFIDEDGNIYKVGLNESERAGCTHSILVSGTFQKHEKNSSGGCVVKTYNADCCKACGKVFLGDLISEFKYTKCPH